MDDLKFRCYHCNLDSGFKITMENRDEVRRIISDGSEFGKVNFICTHCGYANLIKITVEAATKLLARLSSEDPQIQDALDKAKAGDYSKAIDIAKKKLGFRF